jgi:hypothetical protein
MDKASPTPLIESRWPVVLTVLAVISLLAVLPGRVRVLPSWVVYVGGAMLITPMAGVMLTVGNARWLRIERTIMLFFVMATAITTIANLTNLILMMVNRSAELSGTRLLASSIGVWVTNVLVFSLLYWQMDRGGPEARTSRTSKKPDWQFTETGAPEEAPDDWRPTFIDYLFLAYTTATAFSPTDVMPLTSRAKILMMLEGLIALATIVVVAARAINILGG